MAWTAGHAAIAKRRQQLAESIAGETTDQAGTG
ncbi:hypothetical protein QE381_002235 [Microbacterium sp. SORGH_AS 888]|nr:hypothetical protein [Microbacterium sp. SORGH_AS_0888]